MKNIFLKNKVKISIFFLMFIALVILVFIYKNVDSNISINSDAKIENSSELYYVSGVDMFTVKASDIKTVTIGLTLSKNRRVRNSVEISTDDLSEAISNNPNITIMSGSGLESEFRYDRGVTFYAPNVTKDYIIKLFENCKMHVSWQDIFGKKYSKTFYVRDCTWN